VLFEAGFNPFLTGFFKTAAGCEKRFVQRTYAHDNSSLTFSFRRSRDWNSLPRVDGRKAAKMKQWLGGIFEKESRIWMGVVTPNAPPCTIDQIGPRRRDLLAKLRIFMVEQSRAHGVDHFFSVVHESVRDRKTKILKVNAEGRLLYHVNVHFFFLPPSKGKKRDRFVDRMKKRFGKGSGVMEVANPAGAINYLTAVQDRTDLLDYGEFVQWHSETWRTPRFRRYGKRKPASLRKRPREKAQNRSEFIGTMGVENQFIGKIFLGKKSFTIWDNVTDPIANLYDENGIPREPDVS
jgi:hypothetical protein